MFGLYVLISFDEVEWTWLVDSPEGALREFGGWLRRATGTEPTAVSIDRRRRSVALFTLGRGALQPERSADELRVTLRETLGHGRLRDYWLSRIESGEDADEAIRLTNYWMFRTVRGSGQGETLRESERRGLPAFPGPGRQCHECEHPSPGHFWWCPLRAAAA